MPNCPQLLRGDPNLATAIFNPGGRQFGPKAELNAWQEWQAAVVLPCLHVAIAQANAEKASLCQEQLSGRRYVG